MSGLTCALLVVGSALCAMAIPSSLLTDVKQAEGSHTRLTNKVKRAQEVIMFGNQQNRGGDGRNAYALPRADKRGVEESVLEELAATERPQVLFPVEAEGDALEEPKALAQYDKSYGQALGDPEYAQRLQNSVLKSEYYADPAALSELRYYDLDERRKRDTFRTPSKRNSRGLATAGRAKRDLDLDPEELLALLSFWENERRNKLQQNRYNQYSVMDPDDIEMPDNTEGGNDISEEDEQSRPDGWMDGPVALPSRHFSAGAEPWARQRFSDDRRKRFMVSKRRAQDVDVNPLAQYFSGADAWNGPVPQRDITGPQVFRRYVL